MISSEEASRLVNQSARGFGIEEIATTGAVGRFLAEDIFSDRAFPPFDRVCMDGIAINYQAFQNGQRQFDIHGLQAAGSPQQTLEREDVAIEVMTGAMLPKGATTVIRYEDLREVGENRIEIQIDVKDGANIHYTGEDLAADTLILKKGTRIRSAEVALCATVGKSKVSVFRLPKVVVLSTGDELVEIGEIPQPYQIRKSNVHMLAAELRRLGISPDLMHIDDDETQIENTLKKTLEDYDVVMMSGGVSKGKFDFIPDVLTSLGVSKLFHRVTQRPGKPFWFGQTPGCRVFAFPGNPVSTLIGYHKYFIPWFYLCNDSQAQRRHIPLASEFEFAKPLTYFAQARLINTAKGVKAEIKKGHGSGDMINLALVDGFLELPKDQNHFKRGEAFPFISLYEID